MSSELELRTHDRCIGANEREPLAFGHRGRKRLAVHFGEGWFVVEEFQMARSTGHEQVDDGFGFAWKVGIARSQRIDIIAGLRGGWCSVKFVGE